MSRKRERSPSPSPATQVYTSAPIEDRSSKFVAVFSSAIAAETLQSKLEFRDASHRMAAWRHPSKQRSIDSQPLFDTGCDDDGENHGGKNLEKLLNARDITGTVVVARWYGGVMLGPVRFDHIRNCANDAITQWLQESDRASKKAKLVAEKDRLIQVLPERDQSITVLRSLLAEKKGTTPSASLSSPATPMDYSTMQLPVLERLEQVRDKTIGWILEQIEKVERAQELALMEAAQKTED